MSSPKPQPGPDPEQDPIGNQQAVVEESSYDGVGLMDHSYVILVDQDTPGMTVDQLVKSLDIKEEDVAMLQDCETGVDSGLLQRAKKAKGVKRKAKSTDSATRKRSNDEGIPKEGPVTCPDCQKVFKSRKTFKEHRKQARSCQRRQEKKSKEANGITGYECETCKQVFTRHFNLVRHQQKKVDGACNRPNVECHTTSDHVHDWYHREFETKQEFEQFWYDEKWDGQFVMANKGPFKTIYKCSRRGKNTKAKNFTKKNVNCGAYLHMSLPKPTDHPGKKVVLQGCISHCHVLDKLSTRIPKKDKDEMKELSKQGVSNAVLMERYGAAMTHGSYFERRNSRKKRLTEIPQLRDRVMGKIAKLSQRIAEAKETQIGTYDALAALDDWLDKALKMPSEPGSLREIYKAVGGGVSDVIPSFRIGHRQTQTEKKYFALTTAINEAQSQTDDINVRSAVETILPEGVGDEEKGEKFVIFDNDDSGRDNCEDEEVMTTAIEVENGDGIHTVVEDVEVVQVSPFEFVQSMLPNGTVLYKRGEEEQQQEQPEQQHTCSCKHAQEQKEN